MAKVARILCGIVLAFLAVAPLSFILYALDYHENMLLKFKHYEESTSNALRLQSRALCEPYHKCPFDKAYYDPAIDKCRCPWGSSFSFVSVLYQWTYLHLIGGR
jgi:hypothetical protein